MAVIRLAAIVGLAALGGIQEARAQKPLFDTSRPTNLYTFQDNSLEFTSADTTNIFGYRGVLSIVTGEKGQISVELPILYNDRIGEGGLGDMRFGYVWVGYRNYDRFIGALAPSMDVFIPTGRVEDGLGTSRWVISPGLTVGLMVADWIQAFPRVSYNYVSRSVSVFIPDAIDGDRHGMTIESVIPVVFSERFFTQITPIYQIPDFSDSDRSGLRLEVRAAYTLSRKYQAAAFVSRDFETDATAVRGSFLVFFGG